MVMLFLSLKARSDSLPWHVCSAFLLRPHVLSFQPSTLLQLCKIPKCVRVHYDLCLSTCRLPCQECTQFHWSYCASLPPRNVWDSPRPHFVWFLYATTLPRLWGLSVEASLSYQTLNYIYFIHAVFSFTVLNSIYTTERKTDKIPSLMELLLPRGDRQ